VTTEFATLDDAILASFPPQFCRVLVVREQGDHAVALFDMRLSAEPYLYEVQYQRENGRWSEGHSANGAGWHLLDLDSDLGVVTAWGGTPADADRVRGQLEGRVLEDAVENGVYLLVWWNVPESHAEITAFRVKGEWVRASPIWNRVWEKRQAWLRGRA